MLLRDQLPLRGFQDSAANDLIRDPFHGVFADPGTGKSRITLTAFDRMRQMQDVERMLLFAPARVCRLTWPAEVAKWFPEYRVCYLGDDGAFEQDADIFLINPERTPHLFGKPGVQIGPRGGKKKVWFPGAWHNWRYRPELLVFDELSLWKRSTGSRLQAVYRYLEQFGRRQGLTGTPASNGYMDLHGELLMLDAGRALDYRITYYQKRYFDSRSVGKPGRKRDVYDLKDGAAEQIQAAIAPRITVIRARDYLELPEIVTTDVPVEVPAKVIKAVRQLHSEMATEIDGMTLISDNPSGARMRQLVNGVVYDVDPLRPRDPRDTWKVVHGAKIQALEELLTELRQPALVTYEHICERDEVAKALRRAGFRVGVTGRNVKTRDEDAAINAWNARELDVLLLHPCAHGLNLQEGGAHIVWMNPPWNLELYIQLNGRLNRMGQTAKRLFVYHLCARGTFDIRVSRVLCDKHATEQKLLDALEEWAGE